MKKLIFALYCMHIIFIPSLAMEKRQSIPRVKCSFPNCTQTYENDILLFAHLKMHKECDGSLLVCAMPSCQQLFYNKAQRDGHYIALHPELAKDLKLRVRKPCPKKETTAKSKKVKFDLSPKIQDIPCAQPQEVTFTPQPTRPVVSPIVQNSTAAILAAAKITLTPTELPVIAKRKTPYQKFCELESSANKRFKDVEESYSALPKPIRKKRLKSPKKRVIPESEVEIIKEVAPLNRYGCCQRFVNQHPCEYKLHALNYHPELFPDVHDPECTVCARLQNPANGSSSVPLA